MHGSRSADDTWKAKIRQAGTSYRDDKLVHDYIMREGKYSADGRNKPFVRDPIQQLRDLNWNTKQQSLLRTAARGIHEQVGRDQ